MKYFRLLDDINYPQRWYLGDISQVDNNWLFTNGHKIERLAVQEYLHVDVYQDGKEMDYTTTEAYSVPIVSDRLRKKLEDIEGVQFIPVKIDGKEVDMSFFIMVITEKRNYVNEELSDFGKFDEGDPIRPDKAGHYSWFAKLIVDPSKINGEDVFRIEKAEVYLIVSEKIKEALEGIKATGTKFIQV